MDVHREKAALRKQVLGILGGLSPEHRAQASAAARALLLDQPAWQSARTLLFYAPMPGELDIWPLLEQALQVGKIVGLPCFDPGRREYFSRQVSQPGEVITGHFGIREPVSSCADLPLNTLDLLLVPGVAFDQQGFRLGRGKGFYDKLLRNLRGITCGVAFEEQMIPRVPLEPHDVRLNCIVTPKRWISSLPRC